MPKDNAAFAETHAALKRVLQRYEGKGLAAQPDKPGNYVLIGPPTETSRGRDVWFAAVQTRKNYVSFHLMPVYGSADLRAEMSEALKKRMQGKACFNFTRPDPALFRELAQLTDRGYKLFRKLKLIATH
jgi:hypothetical protein